MRYATAMTQSEFEKSSESDCESPDHQTNHGDLDEIVTVLRAAEAGGGAHSIQYPSGHWDKWSWGYSWERVSECL